MKRFFQSLLAKYMLIILMAIGLVQISFLVIAAFVSGIAENFDQGPGDNQINPTMIEEKWHKEANSFEKISAEQINQHFANWKQQYPEASMFWVDEKGRLAEQMNVKTEIPTEWTSSFTAKFIKDRYGGEPFTVIAFVGKNEANGFIVIELPRKTMKPPMQNVYDQFGVILMIGMVIIVCLFIVVSFLFFRSIRKRLMHLQESMTTRDVDGLPIQTDVKKNDEVGQLEQTFNRMVQELRESKQREQEEEQLRRELIANLSHDLRTPLTKIRAQTYSINQENLSYEGKQAIQAMEASIVNIDRHIENLMSYTLLMANKYSFDPKEVDVIRFLRESLATWYPVFEKEGFEIEVELEPFEKKEWLLDPFWLGRIVDNLLQNVIRHAKSGQYICVKTESSDFYDVIVISDKGKGLKHESNERGAGIGLSIVNLMVKGMNLDWDIESNELGTVIRIKRLKEKRV